MCMRDWIDSIAIVEFTYSTLNSSTVWINSTLTEQWLCVSQSLDYMDAVIVHPDVSLSSWNLQKNTIKTYFFWPWAFIRESLFTCRLPDSFTVLILHYYFLFLSYFVLKQTKKLLSIFCVCNNVKESYILLRCGIQDQPQT
jgi:hypothetical protein